MFAQVYRLLKKQKILIYVIAFRGTELFILISFIYRSMISNYLA